MNGEQKERAPVRFKLAKDNGKAEPDPGDDYTIEQRLVCTAAVIPAMMKALRDAMNSGDLGTAAILAVMERVKVSSIITRDGTQEGVKVKSLCLPIKDAVAICSWIAIYCERTEGGKALVAALGDDLGASVTVRKEKFVTPGSERPT